MIVTAAIIIVAVYFASRPSKTENSLSDLSDYELATFAGGCFWCMESAFESTEGVIEAISGYTGGHIPNPSYEQVNTKTTGHLEAVQVYYVPSEITYEELLEVFWRNVNPTDDGGQFVDRGAQYTTAIFYSTTEEQTVAEASKQALESSMRFSEPIVTTIRELDVFYEAEEYHQDYYKKNVVRYKMYESLSGRNEFKRDNWGE